MDIALDVDSTLADTWGAVLKRSDFEEVPSVSWREARDLWDEYLHHSQNAWHNHWKDIERLDLFLMTSTRMLDEFGHRVDVVTSRSGVEEQMQQWLDENKVVYHDFYVAHDKHHLGYDAYIDDSPDLAEQAHPTQLVFLRDRPYNRSVADEDLDNVHRVRHLRHAAFMLTSQPFLDDNT